MAYCLSRESGLMNAKKKRGFTRYFDSEPRREVENCTTIDTIVSPTTQKLDNVSKAGNSGSNTYELPTPSGIVRSMATVHDLFEDVERTSEPLQSVFSNIADLVPKVQIQQVAFDHHCKLLLVTVAKSPQEIENMIEDPGHPVWNDKAVHRNIDRVMARFDHMCFNVLDKHQLSLRSLKVGLQALGVHEKGNKSKSMGFSTPENLPDLVQNLRNYNDIFFTLVCEAVPRRSGHMLGSTFAEDLRYSQIVQPASASVSHPDIDCMQWILQGFYDTVSDLWTCRDHESHSLGILLTFDHARDGALVRSKGFQFIIAVTSPCFDSPYHFSVDLLSGDFSSCQTIEQDRYLSKTCQENEPTEAAVQYKSLDSSINRAGDEGCGILRLSSMVEASKHDLRLAADMCCCLRSLSATMETEGETGNLSTRFLESGSGLRFILSPACGGRDQRQESHSLKDVLWRVSSEGRAIPIKDRLRTASFLAAGFLHLHTSSWLPEAWSSKDIYFFDVDDYGTFALGEPFLQTPLDSNRTRRSVVKETDSTTICSSLLCLGRVLIELAFSAPWQKLQIQDDLTNKLSTGEKDVLNMMLLSKTVSRQLGPRYAKVIQTCLSLGLEAQKTENLKNAELNEIIFEGLVKQLDQCLSVVTYC